MPWLDLRRGAPLLRLCLRLCLRPCLRPCLLLGALLTLPGCPGYRLPRWELFFFSARVAGSSQPGGTLYAIEGPQAQFAAGGQAWAERLYRASPAGVGSQIGAVWSDVSPSGPAGFRSVELDPFTPGRVFTVGFAPPDESFAFRSDDRGDRWTRLVTGLPTASAVRVVAFLTPDPAVQDRLWLGYQQAPGAAGPALFRSDDAGQTWAAQAGYAERSALELVFHPTDPQTRLVRSERSVTRTSDAGVTWTVDVQGLPAGDLLDLAAAEGAPDVYYLVLVVGPRGHVYRRDPGPGGWTELTAVQSLTAAPSPVSAQELVQARSIAVDPQVPTRLYLGVIRYGVFVSEDGGQTFAHRIGGTRGVLFHDLTPYDLLIEPGGRVVAATRDGLYASDDQGQSWVFLDHTGLLGGVLRRL